MAADPELAAKGAWAAGFLVAELQLTAPVLAGLVWPTVRAYRRKDTATGLRLTVLLALGPGGWSVGVPLGLILGWASARRWQVWRLMAGWSALVLTVRANFALAAAMKRMPVEEWSRCFGWLSTLWPIVGYCTMEVEWVNKIINNH